MRKKHTSPDYARLHPGYVTMSAGTNIEVGRIHYPAIKMA